MKQLYTFLLAALAALGPVLGEHGVDCRTIINGLIEKLGQQTGSESDMGMFEMLMMLDETLGKVGLTLTDLTEMASDSGIDLMQFIISLFSYLTEEQPADAARVMCAMQQTIQLPSQTNEQQLRQWLRDGGVEF